MSIQFPDKPTLNETFPYAGMTYVWDGEKWTASGAAAFEDAYVNIDGDTMTGDLQVPNLISEGDVQTTSLNGGPLAGLRNQLINGDFRIWQRGTSFSNTGSQQYTADRWKETGNTAGATVERSTTAPAGFSYSVEMDSNTGSLQYGIELDAENSNGIFAIGSTWTFSVWSNRDITGQTSMCNFRRRVGTGVGAVLAGNFTNWAPVPGEAVSNGFTRYFATVTITGDASTGTDIVCLNVNLPGGDVLSNTVNHAGAQLEPGSVPTPFEMRPISLELQLAQRYYQYLGRSIVQYSNTSSSGFRDFMSPAQTVPFRVVETASITTANVTQATLTNNSSQASHRRYYNINNFAIGTTNGILQIRCNRDAATADGTPDYQSTWRLSGNLWVDVEL